MRTFLNVTQLARKLNVAGETLRVRIAAGEIKPDAKDGKGKFLFDLANLERFKAALSHP